MNLAWPTLITTFLSVMLAIGHSDFDASILSLIPRGQKESTLINKEIIKKKSKEKY